MTAKGNSRSRLLKEQWNIYLEPEQARQLRVLAQQRALPMQVLMREGIDLMLSQAAVGPVTGDRTQDDGDPSLQLGPDVRRAILGLAALRGISTSTLLGEAVGSMLGKHSEETQRRARQAERKRRAEEYRSWSQALLAEQFNTYPETSDCFYGPIVNNSHCRGPLKSPRLCEVRYGGKGLGVAGFNAALADRGQLSGCMIARYRLEDGQFEYRNIGSGHRALERFKQRHVSDDEHRREMAEHRSGEPVQARAPPPHATASAQSLGRDVRI